jgi:hypothetical protein
MQIKDPEIFALIDRIGENYRTNIANRYVRIVLNSVMLDANTREQLEALTEKVDNFRFQGYYFDELYQQILAAARFIYQTRKQILPNIRTLASTSLDPRTGLRDTDKVLRDMAFANLGPNLKVLADQVNELYVKTIAFDKQYMGEAEAVYRRLPELGEIGRYLIG